MAQLFLRLSGPAHETEDGFDVPVEWLLREDGDGVLAEGRGSLAELGRDAPWADRDGHSGDGDARSDDVPEVVALAPVECLLCLARTVPGRGTSQIARALPFAVEEFVTQDIETMHLAHGPITRGAPVSCVLVDLELLTGWLAAIHSAGLTATFLVPDASLLPDEHEVAVLFDGDDALLRTAEHMTRIDAAVLPDALGADPSVSEMGSPEMEADEEDAPWIDVVGGTVAQLEALRLGFPGRIKERPLEGSVLRVLAERFGVARGVNILQGTFAPPRRRDLGYNRWRGVAALAALWLVVFVGARFGEGLWADHRADVLRADAAALYRDLYPDARPPRNAYADMRRRLGQADEPEADFQRLLGALALAIDETLDGVELRSLSFSDGRGELTTELSLREYADLDRLQSHLEERGLVVRIGSAEEQDGVVRARLRLALA